MKPGKKIILWLMFATSFFLYKKAGPAWITNWGIDPATYLFFSFIPLLYLFKVSWKINSYIAIFFIVAMAYFSIIKHEQMAENMAILVFFFFATSIVQRIWLISGKEIKDE